MYTIRLANEFLHGPIWVYDEQGFIRGNFPLVTDAAELNRLNSEAAELHDSFYSDDCRDYDEAGYKAAYPKMKEIINKIIKRLNEINDGSFTIDDKVSNKKWDKKFGLSSSQK